MKAKATKLYYEPLGAFFFTALIVGALALGTYELGAGNLPVPTAAYLGFNNRRRYGRSWNWNTGNGSNGASDGTSNPVSALSGMGSLYAPNQLFNVFHGSA